MRSFINYYLLTVFAGLVFAQPASPAPVSAAASSNDESRSISGDREAVRKNLLALFKACQSGRYSEVAAYSVYRGNEADRKWKDFYHYDAPAERREVEMIASDVKELLDKSDSYQLSKFSEDTQAGDKWYVWEVVFSKNKTRGKVYFAFLKVKRRYALGDIDGHLAYLRMLEQ